MIEIAITIIKGAHAVKGLRGEMTLMESKIAIIKK
jgi:hypothetical protein